MPCAAAYCRSSKDRNDVSIAAQLHELRKLAQTRELTISQTYEDAVFRGSTEDRPAFQRLIADIKRRDRGWSHLLVYDTSRLARGRYIAQVFKHRCRHYGIEILYVKLPETDPVSAVILEAVFEAMDEVHSLMSRERAIAGQAENVRRGFRAGGRAPWGYRLQHEATGTIRDGKPVMKSKLVPGPEAAIVHEYLASRAAAIPRARVIEDLGITLAASSLVAVEWNALTYAGCTVWNRHDDKKRRGQGLPKRRPRAEWQIQENTHKPLITRAQAEAILTQLEISPMGEAVSRARRAMSSSLLSELLEAPDGRRWQASGPHYRLRAVGDLPGKRVRAHDIERAVIQRVRSDLRAPAFIEELAAAARASVAQADAGAPIRAEIERLTRQRTRAAQLALDEGGEIYRELAVQLARQIEGLGRELAAVAAEDQAARELRHLTAADIRCAFLEADDDRQLIAPLRRVILDPDTFGGWIEYGLSMASPTRFELVLPP